jgi:hypothetical protein
MMVSKATLYVHMPRTGGTFISDVLERRGFASRVNIEGGHAPARNTPEYLRRQKILFGTIRDPLSWYKSVNNHYRDSRMHFQGFLHEYMGSGSHSADTVLSSMTHPLEMKIPLERMSHPPGQVKAWPMAEILSRTGLGLWSWMVLWMYSRLPVDTEGANIPRKYSVEEIPWDVALLIDQAHLRQGICDLFDVVDSEKMTDDLRRDIMQEKPKNTTAKSNITWSRPEEARQRIVDADGWLAKGLGLLRPAEDRATMFLLS